MDGKKAHEGEILGSGHFCRSQVIESCSVFVLWFLHFPKCMININRQEYHSFFSP